MNELGVDSKTVFSTLDETLKGVDRETERALGSIKNSSDEPRTSCGSGDAPFASGVAPP